MSEARGRTGARGAVQVIEPSAARLAHARRMAESKATVPHAYAEILVDAKRLAEPAAGHGLAAVVVRACALALGDVPRVNAAYRDARFELYTRINVGLAIDAGGEVAVPTVHDADQHDLVEVAAEIARLRGLAETGEITQPDLAGSTFSVTQPAGAGLSRAVPIIRGGHAAALGAGDLVGGTLCLTLAYDARILLPGEAAAFLAALRAGLEDPARL